MSTTAPYTPLELAAIAEKKVADLTAPELLRVARSLIHYEQHGAVTRHARPTAPARRAPEPAARVARAL